MIAKIRRSWQKVITLSAIKWKRADDLICRIVTTGHKTVLHTWELLREVKNMPAMQETWV